MKLIIYLSIIIVILIVINTNIDNYIGVIHKKEKDVLDYIDNYTECKECLLDKSIYPNINCNIVCKNKNKYLI
jgi:hypothetical protein